MGNIFFHSGTPVEIDGAIRFEIGRVCSSFCTEYVLIEQPVTVLVLVIVENVLRDGFRTEADAAQQAYRRQ